MVKNTPRKKISMTSAMISCLAPKHSLQCDRHYRAPYLRTLIVNNPCGLIIKNNDDG